MARCTCETFGNGVVSGNDGRLPPTAGCPVHHADRDAAQVREVPEAIKEAAERIFQAAYGSGALARRGLLLVAKDELLAAFAAGHNAGEIAAVERAQRELARVAGQRSASEAQPAEQHAAALARRVAELEDAVLHWSDNPDHDGGLENIAARIRAARAQSAAASGEGEDA
jgi:hypothetical protein